jgi:ABC-2 type transport system permease protein
MTIAGRQFRSYFNGPVAYIVVCLVLLVLGFLFWEPFFLYGRATGRELFDWLGVILALAMPALTMGLLAEEKRTGTIELLITMPVRDAEVILGKYLGVLGLFAVMALLTVPYVVSIASLGDLDWGPVVSGYVGLFLLAAAMAGIGLMASSWTANQLVAMFVALFIIGILATLDKLLVLLPAQAASVFELLAFDTHFENLLRGVIDFGDVLYFLSVAGFSLALAFRALESRRWS